MYIFDQKLNNYFILLLLKFMKLNVGKTIVMIGEEIKLSLIYIIENGNKTTISHNSN